MAMLQVEQDIPLQLRRIIYIFGKILGFHLRKLGILKEIQRLRIGLQRVTLFLRTQTEKQSVLSLLSVRN